VRSADAALPPRAVDGSGPGFTLRTSRTSCRRATNTHGARRCCPVCTAPSSPLRWRLVRCRRRPVRGCAYLTFVSGVGRTREPSVSGEGFGPMGGRPSESKVIPTKTRPFVRCPLQLLAVGLTAHVPGVPRPAQERDATTRFDRQVGGRNRRRTRASTASGSPRSSTRRFSRRCHAVAFPQPVTSRCHLWPPGSFSPIVCCWTRCSTGRGLPVQLSSTQRTHHR
jgi:hypothetical protein